MIRKYGAVFLFLLFFLCSSKNIYAQLNIAPPALMFDRQNPISSLIIVNDSQKIQEVSVNTYFGYTTSEDGNIKLVRDSVLAKKKSIAGWIDIFPKRFTIQPDQRRRIKFMLRPPKNIEPGGYWTRVKLTSSPVAPPISSSKQERKVGVRLDIEVNQLITAYYHTPDAKPDIAIDSVSFTQVDSTQTGKVAVAMSQTGNAPFVGKIAITLRNKNGDILATGGSINTVYTHRTKNLTLDLSDIEPGNYLIRGIINSKRPDLKDQKLLKIDPVRFKKQITIE